MNIDVSDILFRYGAQKKVCYDVASSELNDENLGICSPVHIDGTITNLGEIIDFSGILKTSIRVSCDRCLKEFQTNLTINISEKFSPSATGDQDINLFRGQSIILNDVIRDNLIINYPVKNVCSDDCKGLCPSCGSNRNVESCSCENENIDPRLEKLKDFFK